MKRLSIALLGLTISAAVSAADTIQLNNSNTSYDATRAQSDFRTILADMGGAFNYKALNPAEPQGLLGFDLGLNATFANVSDEQAWLNLTGDSIEQIGSIGVKISKGLPLGLDVSGFYNIVPGTDASFYGAAVSYALEEGSIISPALAVRLGYTKGQGIEDFDFETKSIDFTVSKGFTVLTPYAGIGQVFITGTPTSSRAQSAPTENGIGFQEEDFSETRVFAGAKLNVGFQLVVEYENTGDINTWSARTGFGF